jgi:hypothetical protein
MKHSRKHNKKHRNSKRKTMRKLRFRGGNMTTSVETNPVSYKENEYKEMNELVFQPKGGMNTNTPSSQGTMTLSELNVDEEYDPNLSGFAQDQDAEANEVLMQIFNQQNMNNQNMDFEDQVSLGDEDAWTDVSSYPSLQNTDMNQLPSSLNSESDVSTLTDGTYDDDMVMGGKKRKHTKKRSNKKNKNTKRTTRRHKHRK